MSVATYAAVLIAIIYYVIIRSFVDNYLKNYDKTVWEISYVSSEDYPHFLPVIVLPVKGVHSSRITPFQISLNKQIYCSPNAFIEDCWGNESVTYSRFIAIKHWFNENELTCSDGQSKDKDDDDFTWAVIKILFEM